VHARLHPRANRQLARPKGSSNARRRGASPCRVHAAIGTYTNIPNTEEEEEAAPEALREPSVDEDDDDDLYAQPQARLARRLALDGVAELPTDVRAFLVQGLRSIYDGTVEHYKARLVAKGFGQRPSVDFDETFAPTTKWAALRAILALAALENLENLELESIDISNAYLNSKLHDVDVYMQQPDGFAERDSTWVARLLKGLYDLKQGGRE
jgi:hypothetical protein